MLTASVVLITPTINKLDHIHPMTRGWHRPGFMAHTVNSDICPLCRTGVAPTFQRPGLSPKRLEGVTGPDSNQEPRQPSPLSESLNLT